MCLNINVNVCNENLKVQLEINYELYDCITVVFFLTFYSILKKISLFLMVLLNYYIFPGNNLYKSSEYSKITIILHRHIYLKV